MGEEVVSDAVGGGVEVGEGVVLCLAHLEFAQAKRRLV